MVVLLDDFAGNCLGYVCCSGCFAVCVGFEVAVEEFTTAIHSRGDSSVTGLAIRRTIHATFKKYIYKII